MLRQPPQLLQVAVYLFKELNRIQSVIGSCQLRLLFLGEHTGLLQTLVRGLGRIVDFTHLRAVSALGNELRGWLEEIGI